MVEAVSDGSLKATAKAKSTTTSGKATGSNTIPGSQAVVCQLNLISTMVQVRVVLFAWLKAGSQCRGLAHMKAPCLSTLFCSLPQHTFSFGHSSHREDHFRLLRIFSKVLLVQRYKSTSLLKIGQWKARLHRGFKVSNVPASSLPYKMC